MGISLFLMLVWFEVIFTCLANSSWWFRHRLRSFIWGTMACLCWTPGYSAPRRGAGLLLSTGPHGTGFFFFFCKSLHDFVCSVSIIIWSNWLWCDSLVIIVCLWIFFLYVVYLVVARSIYSSGTWSADAFVWFAGKDPMQGCPCSASGKHNFSQPSCRDFNMVWD